MQRSSLSIGCLNGIGLCFLGCSIALRTEVVGDAGALSESGVDPIGTNDGSSADGSLVEANVDASLVDSAPTPDTTPTPPVGSCASKVPYLFCDDFESGLGQWTPNPSADVAYNAQSLATGPNNTPTNVLAVVVNGDGEGYLQRKVSVPAASAQVEIQFRFRYDSFTNIGQDLFFATILTSSGGGGGGGGGDDGYSFYLDRKLVNTGLSRFKREGNNREELSAALVPSNWYGVSVVIEKATRNYVTKLVSGGNTQTVDQGQFKDADQLEQLELRFGFTGEDGNNKNASFFVDEVVVR